MAQFVVTVAEDVSNSDTSSGDLSLREAIQLANANGVSDTITFASGINEITLQDSLPTITADLTIRGGRSVTLDANADGDSDAATSVDEFGEEPVAERRGLDFNGAGDVTIDGLTITGGYIIDEFGGGIRANSVGSVSIVGSTLVSNVAGRGGGLSASGVAELFLTDSSITENYAHGDARPYTRYDAFGGGAYTNGGVTVARCEITNNAASAYNSYGGGICARGDVRLIDSFIGSNSATGHGGRAAS
jgi:hypothetical protein